MITRKALLDLQENLCSEAYALMAKKSNDYASDSDGMANFRASEAVGVDMRDAILARMMDKVSRLANVAHGKEMQVSDEKIEDTTLDLINFAVLLHAAIMEKRDVSDS